MMKKKTFGSLIALLIVIALATGTVAFSNIDWTWKQYDNPTGNEYRLSNGNSWSFPQAILPLYQAPSGHENEMRLILPAFSSKKFIGPENTPGSFQHTPRHDEYQAFIRDLANTDEGKARMRIKPIGEYPKGFPLTLAVFSKPAVLEPDELKALGKPIVWAQGAIHGGEQDAVSALSYAMYKLAIGHWDHYLDKVSVIILIRLNADGAFYTLRGGATLPTKVSARNAAGEPTTAIDMNRDNMWLESPVLRAVHSIWSTYQPHIHADLHQMGISSSFGGNSAFVASRDAAGNPLRDPASGRVLLLVSRDATGKPIYSSQPSQSSSGTLINLATLTPRNATPANPRTAIPESESLYRTWDTGWSIGDHGNVPVAFRNYFYDKMLPYMTKHMEDNFVRLGLYPESPTAPGISMTPWGEPVYMPYAGEIRPNPSTTPGSETITVYDGTGVEPGAAIGLWLDTGNMHSTTTLKGSMGFLLESRSSGAWIYPRRTYAQWRVVESLIKFAADHTTEFMNITNATRAELANLNEVYTMMKYADKPITLKDIPYYTASGDEVFRDFPTYHPSTTFARDGYPPRKRPNAYILPKSEVNAIAAARMSMHGVKYFVLTEDTQVNVEVFENLKRGPLVYWQNNQTRGRDPGYSTTTQSPDLVPWTPGFLVQVTQPVAKSVMVPKGSFVIYTNQPYGGYIAAVMEPDAERSFARFTMARRLERDPLTFANNPVNWTVPYRYMLTANLPVKEVVHFYPLVEKAFIMDVRHKTGVDLPNKFAMLQEFDVMSDADGFRMQVPAFDDGKLVLCAYNWATNKYVELTKVVSTYNVPNVFAVAPELIGPVFEGYTFEIEPLAKAMNMKTVRVALIDKTYFDEPEKPEKPEKPCDPLEGCNAMSMHMLALLLIPMVLARRRD